MPIYEYRCASCGHELEALQKFSDPALTTCPACHAEQLVKRVSAAGFQLKGTGWYATDFRGGKSTAAKDGKDGKPGTDGKDSGDAAGAGKPKSDGEAKSETKAEAKNTSGTGTPGSSASAPST